MRSRLLGCLLAAGLFSLPARGVAQTTIDFDDLSSAASTGHLPDPYFGFQWNNIDWIFASLILGGEGAHSGANVAYKTGPLSVAGSFTSATPFTFNTIYLNGPDAGLGLSVRGLRNGVEIFQRALQLGDDWALYSFDWENIDGVEFQVDGAVNRPFQMDDITVNAPVVTPEPLTSLLIGTGLAGVGAAARRRRRRTEPADDLDDPRRPRFLLGGAASSRIRDPCDIET